MKKARIAFTIKESTKKEAEKVANQLGISISTVLNMCLIQMVYQRRIPFSAKLPTINRPRKR